MAADAGDLGVTVVAFVIPRIGSPDVQRLMFWGLAMLVATSQGGVQALSRSVYARLIPRERAAEFFGFYNIVGKASAIVGPLLLGVTTQLTGSIANGVLAIVVLFVIGGAILTRVPAETH